MACLQSATTSVGSLLTVVILLLAMSLCALMAVLIGMRTWEVYQNMPRVEGDRARALRGILSGVVALAIVAPNFVASWNHCSLDNKFLPTGVGGIYVAYPAMAYFFSTFHPPPARHSYQSTHPYLSTVPVMVSGMVHDHPRRSLVVFMGGVLSAGLPFLCSFALRRQPSCP